MATAPRKAGEDQPVSDTDSLTVLTAVDAYKREAEEARRIRLRTNRRNLDAFMGIQDFSGKARGQSKQFLPQTATAVEQFAAFAKRALVQFGDWFEVNLGRSSQSPLNQYQIRELMKCFLDRVIVEDGKETSFPLIVSDALKMGSIESLIVLKVHGETRNETRFVPLEDGINVGEQDFDTWHLRIDIVRSEDYYPDPSGRGLYEIHSVERDLHTIQKRAAEGLYDQEAVNALVSDLAAEDTRKEEENRRRQPNEDTARNFRPSFRKSVVLDEFWGDILDSQGQVVHKNVFCVIANGKHILRRPAPNPFWHKRSPFVAVPLIRVPFSAWHKGLMDDAVNLNLAQNEVFNLILDGGLASVWGTRQVRLDALEDPKQVSDGIPQGATLAVNNTLPHGEKAVETVTTGDVPQDAMAVFEMLTREFVKAALTNETKLGSFPGKQVLATEVVEVSQSQAVTLDAIVADVERELIAKTLELVWMNIIQHMDGARTEDIVSAVGIDGAFELSRLSPAQRWALFSNGCAIRVSGMSATLAKVRDFQKLMAMLQAVTSNPLLLQAFFMKYSPNKVISHLMKTLNINPEQMEKDEEELANLGNDFQNLQFFQGITNPSNGGREGGAGLSAEDAGEPSLPAEINQATNPATGLV
jgi:hypothetical protein